MRRGGGRQAPIQNSFAGFKPLALTYRCQINWNELANSPGLPANQRVMCSGVNQSPCSISSGCNVNDVATVCAGKDFLGSFDKGKFVAGTGSCDYHLNGNGSEEVDCFIN